MLVVPLVTTTAAKPSGAALSSIPTVAASAGTELPHATLTRHTSTNAGGIGVAPNGATLCMRR